MPHLVLPGEADGGHEPGHAQHDDSDGQNRVRLRVGPEGVADVHQRHQDERDDREDADELHGGVLTVMSGGLVLPDVSMPGWLSSGDSRCQGRGSRTAPAHSGERPDDRELRSIAACSRDRSGLRHRDEQRDHHTGLVAPRAPGGSGGRVAGSGRRRGRRHDRSAGDDGRRPARPCGRDRHRACLRRAVRRRRCVPRRTSSRTPVRLAALGLCRGRGCRGRACLAVVRRPEPGRGEPGREVRVPARHRAVPAGGGAGSGERPVPERPGDVAARSGAEPTASRGDRARPDRGAPR